MVIMVALRCKLEGIVILSEALLGPLVLLHDLSLLLWAEIIFDIEVFSNFLNGFILDHTGNLSASQFEERLDVHVVGGED